MVSVRAEAPLDLLVIDHHSLTQLMSNLPVLRNLLERSIVTLESSRELLLRAKNNPQLESAHVKDHMSHPVSCLPQGLTIGQALQRSKEERKGAYPVVDAAGNMIGLVTRSDFYQAVHKLKPLSAPLTEIMRHPVITIRENETLTAALLLLLRQPVKRLIVVAEDNPQRPVGVLTPFDIVEIVHEPELAPTNGVTV